MKTASRINTHSRRFDIRLAAGCMHKNTTVAEDVLANEVATDAERYQATRLIEVTEMNLALAVQAYLKQL